ncbi:MAG: hypothetical protein KA987_09570 [Saprospiraceae bacterium]|nr:hypothetical protein [Saprospiraceae bacterium]
MTNYSDIIKLYGTPISQIPIPYKPRKFSNIHIVLGTAVGILALIGIYHLINQYRVNNLKIKESKSNSTLEKKNEANNKK